MEILKKICVVGLGYIGLPTASVMAMHGFHVLGVDINETLINDLKKGEIHIYEPNLAEAVKTAIHTDQVKFSVTPEEADVFILAVPTPFKENHKADVSYIKSATELIIPFLKEHDLVILESTSPVGTTEKIGEWICEKRIDLYYTTDNLDEKENCGVRKEIFIAHCPERVLPGKILKEIVTNDRIIGGVNKKAAQMAEKIYQHFVTGDIFLTDARTAEMAKLTENSFRDLNIAFANELSMICDKLNIDVWELIALANRHPRVNILEPGPGVGGHCIAVDPWFIVDSAPKLAQIIRKAREVNDYKPQYVVEKAYKQLEGIKNPVIMVLGLAFKADVDDLRESPAVEIVNQLAENPQISVRVVEPYIKELPAILENKPNVALFDLVDGFKKADLVLVLVNHKAFYNIDKSMLAGKKVMDTRGIWR